MGRGATGRGAAGLVARPAAARPDRRGDRGSSPLLGGPGLGERNGPPVEELAVERTVLRPGEIELTVRNDGPDRSRRPGRGQRRLRRRSAARDARSAGSGATTREDPLPVDRGRGLRGRRCSPRPAATIDARDPVAVETPEADLGFFGLMALLGLYVGVIPVASGCSGCRSCAASPPRWLRVLMAFTVGLLGVPRDRRDARGPRDRRRGPAGVRRRGAGLARALRRLPGAGRVDAYLRARRERRAVPAGAPAGAPLGAAGRGRDRPAQPRRGAGDRLGLRDRGARAGRLPRRRLRDPQHHRGPGDRRAAGASGRPASARLALLGLIAGAPAILGAWIGAAAFNPSVAAFLFGVGVGAIVQVILQIAPTMRDGARPAAAPARRRRACWPGIASCT